MPRDEFRRELAAPAEEVAPRLFDDIQLLAVEGLHFRDCILFSRSLLCTPEQSTQLPGKSNWRKVSDCRTGQQ